MWDREPIGGPFALIDHNGKLRTDADFRGKLMLVYFGFTYCPDVCPTDLQSDRAGRGQARASGEAVQPLFITVDPDATRRAPCRVRAAISPTPDRSDR